MLYIGSYDTLCLVVRLSFKVMGYRIYGSWRRMLEKQPFTLCNLLYILIYLIFWKRSDKSSYIPNSIVQKLSNSVQNGQKMADV